MNFQKCLAHGLAQSFLMQDPFILVTVVCTTDVEKVLLTFSSTCSSLTQSQKILSRSRKTLFSLANTQIGMRQETATRDNLLG